MAQMGPPDADLAPVDLRSLVRLRMAIFLTGVSVIRHPSRAVG